MELLGLISMPLAGVLGNRLADKGYSGARTLGIVLITYMAWIFSYLWGFNWKTILTAVLVLCLLSIILYKKQGNFPRRQTILSNELVFNAGFFLFLLIRIYLPQIYRHEKFMDFAFLNAVMRTASFPPADPWFAGGSLDFYYYLGYVSVGALGKLFSVEPSMLFNLAVALTFALTLNLLFGLGYNLTSGNRKYGIITAVVGAVLGNIQGLIELKITYFDNNAFFMGYYWSSSRVIPYTINEFPYFSFIHGDLHSHMLAIPFQLLILTFLLNIYFRKNEAKAFENGIAFIIFSVALGFLFPSNSWDFPVYFGLACAVIFIFYYGIYLRNKNLLGNSTRFFGTIALIILFSLLFYLPFYLHFKPQAAGGFALLEPGLRTIVEHFLILFGLFLFLIYSFLVTRLNSMEKMAGLILWVGLSALLSKVLEIPLILVLSPLFVLAAFSFLKDLPYRTSVGFVSLLTAAAAFLALFCEVIYLDDPISGDFARMNTVFKFYMHVWLFLALAACYSYYELNQHYKIWAWTGFSLDGTANKLWAVALIVLVISCTVFPVVATYTRIEDMKADPSLDGMDYIKKLDRGDYNAIKWMQENISGSPVILEASNDNGSYTYVSRVSANTGLPTVIGWSRHERFWGRDPQIIKTRLEDVHTIYTTGSIKKSLELMDKYNVSYVYIGQLERQMYYIRADKFRDENYFEPVYQGSVEIYKIKKYK